MRKQYSFLSPANINFVIMKLRGMYPEHVHHEIRESIPSIAHDWFYNVAVTNEQQFVGGTTALNQAFIGFIVQTKQFMPNPPDILSSYSTEIMDPYVPNQQFQHLNNDIIYPNNNQSDHHSFDHIKPNPLLTNINRELAESTIGGIPIYGNMHETKIACLATEISRNRVKPVKAPTLTWGVQHQCNDNFTSCEHTALPRKKFTLPRDYYESAPPSAYWIGYETSCLQNIPNPRLSKTYTQDVYGYPNYAFYRKDIIPSVPIPNRY